MLTLSLQLHTFSSEFNQNLYDVLIRPHVTSYVLLVNEISGLPGMKNKQNKFQNIPYLLSCFTSKSSIVVQSVHAYLIIL